MPTRPLHLRTGLRAGYSLDLQPYDDVPPPGPRRGNSAS